MNCSDNTNCTSCIFDVLKKILLLQKQDFDNTCYVGCDKPFLGPTAVSVCYNTRPFQLYNCCTGTPWSFDLTAGDGTSNVFRIESLDDCCCTCRLLTLDPETSTYTGTSDFVTLDLNCCGAIRCLADTYIDLC